MGRSEPFKFTTLQNLFETMYLGIMRQGKPAYEGGHCLYRASDGSACAVGVLLTDEQAARAFVACNGASYICSNPEMLPTMAELGIQPSTDAMSLCYEMQIHGHDRAVKDTKDNPENFLTAFSLNASEIAKRFGLTVPSFYTKAEQAAAYRKVAEWIEANPSRLIATALRLKDDDEDEAEPSYCYCTVGAFQPACGLPPPPSYLPGFIGLADNAGTSVYGTGPDYVRLGSPGIGLGPTEDVTDRSLRNPRAEKEALGVLLWEANDNCTTKDRPARMAEACRKVADYLDPAGANAHLPGTEDEPSSNQPDSDGPQSIVAAIAQASTPTEKPFRGKCGSKAWWADVFRRAADILGKPGVAHIAGTLGHIVNGSGCACAIGAINYAANGHTRKPLVYDESLPSDPYGCNWPAFVHNAIAAEMPARCGRCSGDWGTLLAFNDGFADETSDVALLITTDNPNFQEPLPTRLLKLEDSVRVRSVLRAIAYRIEHAGRSYSEQRAYTEARKLSKLGKEKAV